jgi:hypothetical protein
VQRLAQQVLANVCSIGCRSGAYFGQEEQFDASDANQLAHGFATARIVRDDGPGLVDETRTLRLDVLLILAPLQPAGRDVDRARWPPRFFLSSARHRRISRPPDDRP